MWKAALSATRVITPATWSTEFIVSAVDFRWKRKLNVSCKRNLYNIVKIYLQATQSLIPLELLKIHPAAGIMLLPSCYHT